MSTTNSKKNASVFIVPHKIQKKRLIDMKSSMNKKKIRYVDSFTSDITHVVTEYDTVEQVQGLLNKEGHEIPSSCLVVKLHWLTACLKASTVVDVEDIHLVKQLKQEGSQTDTLKDHLPEWACQRVARIDHLNKKLSDSIEVLQKHAELRDDTQDYSRALAFRRASCVLKSLSFKVSNVSQLEGLRDIGNHVKRVLSDVIDKGFSSEVAEILGSSWYKKMELFTSVFGVGPLTAKKWIDKGFESIKDVKAGDCGSSDWRVVWGLGFHDDLTMPVEKTEAQRFVSVVQEEAEKILPGVIVQLCGGFRRRRR